MDSRYLRFIHPADHAAQQTLRSIPLLDKVAKQVLKIYHEQLVHNEVLGGSIRLGPRQLPEIYNLLPPICNRLGIEVPDFYLKLDRTPNAFAMGDSRRIIEITSGLIETMDKDELKSVIAHECGHIACRHTLYNMITAIMIDAGQSIFGPLGMLSQPLQIALLAWSRRSEFSADRAAAFALGGPEESLRCFIRLAGAPKGLTSEVNVAEFLRQADEFVEPEDETTWNRLLRGYASIYKTHPFAVVRYAELAKWCASPDFDEALRMTFDQPNVTCRSCGSEMDRSLKFCTFCGASISQNGRARRKLPSGQSQKADQ